MAAEASFLLLRATSAGRNMVALALAREDAVDDISAVSGEFNLVARVRTTDETVLSELVARMVASEGVEAVERLQGRPPAGG